MAQEVFGGLRTLWTDSQSALSMVVNEGGSWRTRHLRLKSAHARMRVLTGEWNIRHMSGESMVSDIGTKPLAAARLEFLKREMDMMLKPTARRDPEAEGERSQKVVSGSNEAIQVVRLLTMAAMLQVNRAWELPLADEGRGDLLLVGLRGMCTLLVVLAGMLWLWRALSSRPDDASDEAEEGADQGVSSEVSADGALEEALEYVEGEYVEPWFSDGDGSMHLILPEDIQFGTGTGESNRVTETEEEDESESCSLAGHSSFDELDGLRSLDEFIEDAKDDSDRESESTDWCLPFSVIKTFQGTRYHPFGPRCPSLANRAGRFGACPWCVYCGRTSRTAALILKTSVVWVDSLRTAHLREECQGIRKKKVECCRICGSFEGMRLM